MDNLINAIGEAWEKVKVSLMEDEGELRRRLKRRTTLLSRPPRAWCLAVRASDHRITPTHALITPEWALDPRQCDGGILADHTVLLDSRLLRRLTRPMKIPAPGLPAREVAEMLGMGRTGLQYALRHGAFQVRYISGLDGKHGKPIPLIYSDRMFDPSTGCMRDPIDKLWGTFWRYLSDHVPPGIEQHVTRTAIYRNRKGANLFNGLKWVCPACRRTCKTLFYPLPPLLKAAGISSDLKSAALARLSKSARADLGIEDEPIAPCFACDLCHRLQRFSRVDKESWNHFIAHLTAGMLYGHEVTPPPDLVMKRKVPYRERASRLPPGLRQEILSLLIAGQSANDVARELGISAKSVVKQAARFYSRLGVKNLKSFAKAMRARIDRNPRHHSRHLKPAPAFPNLKRQSVLQRLQH